MLGEPVLGSSAVRAEIVLPGNFMDTPATHRVHHAKEHNTSMLIVWAVNMK